MARPTKLTPERQERLTEAIAQGMHYETACQIAGIDYSTFRKWMQRGEEDTSGLFFEFFEAVTRAEAEAEFHALGIWRAAMPNDWRAAQMFLERRYPQRWGRQTRVDVNQEGRVQVNHTIDTQGANALLAALGYDPIGTTDVTLPTDLEALAGSDASHIWNNE